MRTNIVTGTQPCHVEPSLRIVHQGRSHGIEHHPKVQEEIRYNFALQTYGNKNSRRTVKRKKFREIKRRKHFFDGALGIFVIRYIR